MSETTSRGEIHGCIVCGKLHQLLTVYDADGKLIGTKVMSAGGKEVKYSDRPLVACDRHSEDEINRAIQRVFGEQNIDD